MNGTHSHSTVEGYFGLGDEQAHKTTFNFDADHPELIVGGPRVDGWRSVEMIVSR